MAYPKDITAQSHAILLRRREQAAERQAALRARVTRTLPEAIALERDIASTSARLARALLSGEDIGQKVADIRDFNLDAQRRLAGLLTASGFAPDALAPHPTCPLCGDSGVRDGAVCDCVRQIQKRLMYDRLGADAPIEVCGFDRFDLGYYSTAETNGVSPARVMAKALDTCRRWAETFSLDSPSLLLSGAPGLGKTHLSLSISFAVIEQGHDVLYVPFHTLLGRLESARFGRGGDDYHTGIAAPMACELLVLDDLGAEFSTSFGSSVLYEIINSRQLKGLPTIISTNLKESELSARYGERLHSRLCGCFQNVFFVGKDVRLQKKIHAK